jgi:hypothetical protein
VWRMVRAPIAALVIFGNLGAVFSPVASVQFQRPTELRVAITAPGPGTVVQGRTLVTGWAVDPTSPDGVGVNPRDIQLWLGAPPDGYLLDYAQYGQSSPEAAGIYGPESRDTGFVMDWETCSFPAGSHELWAFVSSSVRPGMTDFTRVDVTVSPCPPGTVLFRADWSTVPQLITEQSEQGPVDEGWIVRRLQPGAAGRGVEGVYGDFLAEVTAQRVSSRDGYYFLDFRVLPGPGNSLTDAFYRFTVHPASGRYRLGISRPGPDPVEDIIPWTESSAIQRSTTPNRLGVEAVGPRLRLYANGDLLAETSHPELRWGKIRFGAATGDDPTTETYFRDFVITTAPR